MVFWSSQHEPGVLLVPVLHAVPERHRGCGDGSRAAPLRHRRGRDYTHHLPAELGDHQVATLVRVAVPHLHRRLAGQARGDEVRPGIRALPAQRRESRRQRPEHDGAWGERRGRIHCLGRRQESQDQGDHWFTSSRALSALARSPFGGLTVVVSSTTTFKGDIPPKPVVLTEPPESTWFAQD